LTEKLTVRFVSDSRAFQYIGIWYHVYFCIRPTFH